MLELENAVCRVLIAEDRTYTVNSADNRRYDTVLNPGNYSRRDRTVTLCIDIERLTGHLRIALIGGELTGVSRCAVLEGEVLPVLQDRAATQLRVTDGALLRSVDFGGFGHNYAILQAERGYLVCGEMEITMLDRELNRLWSFSGQDISISVTGRDPVQPGERSIVLYDFEDNRYEIDYSGHVIS